MITSADLRHRHADTWDAAVGHRFVDELWAGTVDDVAVKIADALSASGFSDEDVLNIMGRNWLRFFARALPQ